MMTPNVGQLRMSARRIHRTGLAFALISAIFWGLSALAAQYLFVHAHVHAGWLVSLRMAIAGVVLLGVLWTRKGWPYIFAPLHHNLTRIYLVIFAVLGLFLVQYAYMAAIEHGNAASATLLQYTAPAMITVFGAVSAWRFPSLAQTVAVLLSLAGTWLLVSDGHWGLMRLSSAGLFWGMASAVALAFYTLFPAGLLTRWGAARIVAWGMLVGSLFSQTLFPLWVPGPVIWSWWSFALLLYIVVPGTLVAFWLYLASLQKIAPASASLIASAEPLVAAAGSVLWLGVLLHKMQDIGAIMIVMGVMVLSFTLGAPHKIIK